MSIAKDQRATKDPQTSADGCDRSVRASAKVLRSPITRSADPYLDAARAPTRQPSTGITDWIADDPAWSTNVPEVIGAHN